MLVVQERRSIRFLAAALLERRTLSGDEAAALLPVTALWVA